MSTIFPRVPDVDTGDDKRSSRLAGLLIARDRQTQVSYVLALAAVAAATGVSFLFPPADLANIVNVYLLAVVLVAAKLGRGPSVLATVSAAATFPCFFVPNYYSFVLSDLRYLPTFLILLFVGLVVSSLTSELRWKAITAHLREQRNQALYRLSRGLAAAETREDTLAVVREHMKAIFRCHCRMLEATPDGILVPCPRTDVLAHTDVEGLKRAEVALRERTTDMDEKAVLLPLVVANVPVGVLCCEGISERLLASIANVRLLEAFANNVAINLHRIVVNEHARASQRRAEDERLRNIMLSSMSHDFRTPLASITGAVTTLIDESHRLDEPTRADLLHAIREDAEFLERQIRNMLDLTRLESGKLEVQRELHPLDEVIGSAMTRVEKTLEGRPVEVHVSAHLPLVAMDASLVERLLVNLLENAVHYAPSGSAIDVGAHHVDDWVHIEVADRGPGIPAHLHERVFEKFFRVGGSRRTSGSGLGLAICKAITELHDGRIWVEDRPGGGARFVVELPIGEAEPSEATTATAGDET